MKKKTYTQTLHKLPNIQTLLFPVEQHCWMTRWRRGWQPCCVLRENFAVFHMFYLFFLLFCVLDVVSITVYDRDTLLNIGSSVAQRKPDFEFLNAGGLFTDWIVASEPFVWVVQSRKRRRRRKRGKRAGVLVRLRRRAFRHPLPTILLANVQSLDNKLWTAGAHLIPTRNKGLLCYLPHRNLDVCYGSRLSHRAHGLRRASLG